MSSLATFGPVQMLVLEFDRTRFDGEVMPELERLKDQGIIRVIDLLFVAKPEGGELEVVQRSDLTKDDAMEFGAIVGALVGLGTEATLTPPSRTLGVPIAVQPVARRLTSTVSVLPSPLTVTRP